MTLAELLAQWLIRSSILIAAGALLLWLSRVKDGSIRTMAWTAILCGSLAIPVLRRAFPETLVPSPRRTAAGVVVHPAEVRPAVSEPPPAEVLAPVPRRPVSERSPQAAGSPEARSTQHTDFAWVRVIVMLYMAVCAIMLARICAGLWIGSRLFRRSCATGQVAGGIEIRESEALTAPVTLGILRPAIVLPSDWRQWDSVKSGAVLAHERSHVQRHDVWVQLLSGLHRALLWGSPLSWFLHRRIVQSAEEASDDAAVAAICDRVCYAETLLEFMQRGVWTTGPGGASMAHYGSPAKRIRRVLNSSTLSKGVTKRSVAAIAAVALPLTYMIATAQTRPQFDIADVHVSAEVGRAIPSGPASQMRGGGIRAGMYQIQNATMVDLIMTAYGIDSDKVVGGPSWLELDRFDVFAKTPASTSVDTARVMLQALLTDRFKLTLHRDSRPLAGFVLTVGKGEAPKLKRAAGSGSTGCRMTPQYTDTELAARRQAAVLAGQANPAILQTFLFTCQNMSMTAFAEAMRKMPDAKFPTVADRTGLSGEWDFNFRYTSQPPASAAASEADVEKITIFEALGKQLGLKLEAGDVPTPVIVVDSVNRKPTDNPPNVKAILPPPPPAAFEVASLKLSAPNAPEVRSPGPQPGGRFEVQNFPLNFLIRIAWGLPSNGTLQGKPSWLDSMRVDLTAKLPSTDATRGIVGGANMEAFAPALKELLTERFRVAIHTEQRPVPGYALVGAKPKIRRADPSVRTKCFEGPGADGKDPRVSNPLLSRLVTCRNMTVPEFAQRLAGLSGAYLRNQLVVDATGIEGAYDFTLNFTAGMGGAGGPSDVSIPDGGITLFEALEKQLGLKLEKRNIPAPVVILDHIEQKPTEN